MRDCESKVCVNIYCSLEFKGTLEHLIQLSEQKEARDVNDLPKVTGFISGRARIAVRFFL